MGIKQQKELIQIGLSKMKTYKFDALNEDTARKFIGCKVLDETGALVGKVGGLWTDPSTHQVGISV